MRIEIYEYTDTRDLFSRIATQVQKRANLLFQIYIRGTYGA